MDLNRRLYSMKNILYLLLLTALIFSSCVKDEKKLKLLKVTEYNSSKVTDTSLTKLLKIKNGLDISLDYTLSQDFALKQLQEKKVDLVILPNNVKSGDYRFKTIIPLLPRFFVLMTNKEVSAKSIKTIIENGTVYYEERSKQDSLIFNNLYYSLNINREKVKIKPSTELNINRKTDSLQLYAGLIHMNNLFIRRLIGKGWYFYSIGDVDYYGKGSKIEGFTMMNTSTYPFIIPMSIIKGKPINSLLTFAINDILICREDLDEDIAYGITKTMIENKSQLSEMNSIYNLLNFDYDSQVLSFPKHKGTQKYLNRDDPPVWSRYVNMVWPIISISVVIFGVISSFRQRYKRRKKQKIESYYNTLLEIRDKSETAGNKETFIEIMKELKILRSKAMRSLANRKLDPGESFNIFLALYNEVRNDVAENIKEMRQKEQKESKTKA